MLVFLLEARLVGVRMCARVSVICAEDPWVPTLASRTDHARWRPVPFPQLLCPMDRGGQISQ